MRSENNAEEEKTKNKDRKKATKNTDKKTKYVTTNLIILIVTLPQTINFSVNSTRHTVTNLLCNDVERSSGRRSIDP